jgi:hypothetical protein
MASIGMREGETRVERSGRGTDQHSDSMAVRPANRRYSFMYLSGEQG